MKNFNLYRVFGFNLTNEALSEFISNNAYRLDEFTTNEEYRCGYTPIHKKLEKLTIDGNGFVKASFKMAVRTINKKLLADMVSLKAKEQKEKGIEPNKADIEAAMRSKLKPFADIKLSTFDIIFDTKNNLIYTSSSTKVFEDKFIPHFKLTYEDAKFRPFKPRFDEVKMATFFSTPDAYLTDEIKVASFVEIEKDDGALVTFKDATLKIDDEFQAIIEKGCFKVKQVDMRLTQGEFISNFRINKKAMPTSINVFGTETDSEMSESAEMSEASSEGNGEKEKLTKEQILYDNLYANAMIMMPAFAKIAEFTMDFEAMKDVAEKVELKISEKNSTEE